MKILKIAGAFFGLFIVVFFLLGVFVPDFEYENSVTVEASQQECWKVFHDVSRMKEWTEGFESLTLKKGAFLQEGSVYEMVIVSDGERMVMEESITSIRPAEYVSYELSNEVLKSEYAFTFDAKNNHQTVIQGRYKVTGSNLLWRSLLFLSKSYLAGTSKQQLMSLKKVIEVKS
jgi:hypothetical protein